MIRGSVHRANLLVFGTLIAILLLIAAVVWDRFDAARSARLWSQRSYAVLSALDELDLSIHDAETGQRGYLLTGREDYLEPYTRSLGQVTLLQGTLEKLTEDDPRQQERLYGLAPVVQDKLNELAETVEMRREFGLNAALPIINTDLGLKAMSQIESMIAAMSAAERDALSKHIAELDRRAKLVRAFVFGGTALSILGLLIAAWMLNEAWRRSRQVEERQRSLIMRLRTSLDSLSQGVGVFDAGAQLANWNEPFHMLLGLPKALVRLRTPYNVFAEHAAAEGIVLEKSDIFLRLPLTGPQPVVYEAIRDDGRQLELRRTQVPDGGFVLTISDMTERVQAEGVLREAQKMQAIGQLTGGVAHDFNNLLTVILGNLEAVRRKLDGQPGLQTRIDRGMWAAQRGATLTSQLLSFARKQPLAPAPIDLGATMPDLVPRLRQTLGEPVDIRYERAVGLWPAMVDAGQLESALLNLALNARDAMPAGGRLTIALANQTLGDTGARSMVDITPGDYVVLTVSDTGYGMPPEVITHAFEPFFTTKRDGKGSGLGLAMVYGFVKQSGGHVEITSTPGEGTSVLLYLPRARNEIEATLHSIRPPAALPQGSGTILIVEDEAAVREIAASTLRELGYRVFEAWDGEEAMLVFRRQRMEIDLLLVDIVLPGRLRGRDVAESITSIRPGIATLYMSGYTENASTHHGRSDEDSQFIGKPFTQEQLAWKVAGALGLTGDPMGKDQIATRNATELTRGPNGGAP